ncbi:copper-transporting ATPase [candidate division MSBL1 archaeon SCGC-AAA259A05]|uniref:Copper-transporting ATPase n=1 Tax=candidate division MSBL1 archaeon SCGC-AAA259A05 TaxID=1698259 RepID=A0A133U6H5_9EURY|nr:copper-transporting ATPase [candidate division MSBL1 archaeon SCGC-AAA259A05]
MATDPVCGMEVDPEEAPAETEHEGETIYFCCSVCKEKFEENPEKFM